MSRFDRVTAVLSMLIVPMLVGGAAVFSTAPLQAAVFQEESSEAALALYADAAGLQNNKAFKPAAEEWKRFLAKYPKDPLVPKAQHYLGICLLQQKEFAKAADAFAVVVDKFGNEDIAEDALLNLGWCRFSLATRADGPQQKVWYEKSLASFDQLIKRYAKGKYADQALYFKAESLFNLQQRKQAITAYGQLVTAHPKSALRCDALYAMGVAQEELGDYPSAGKTYDKFLADCPESELVTEVKMRKGETVLQAGQYQQASAIFAEVAAVKEFDAIDHALSRQAFCLAKMQKPLEAAGLYVSIVQQYPNSPLRKYAVLAAGRSYYRAGRSMEAANWLERAVNAGGNEAMEAGHWLCRLYLDAKQPAKALRMAEELLPKAAGSPYLVNLKMDQADAQYAISDLRAKAMANYVALAKEFPKNILAPQALYNAAFAAMELKDSAKGIQYAEAFATSFPRDELLPDVRYVAAECHVVDKRYDQAAAIYADLAKNFPQHEEIETWQLRSGLMLYLQKKYQETIAQLRPILDQLKDSANRAEGFYLVGASHFQLNAVAEATQAFQASIEANSKWRQADEAMIFLSRSLHREGKTAEAVVAVGNAITTYPKSRLLDHARYRMGEYQYALKQYPQAVASYGIVLDQYPNSLFVPFSLYGQGWSYLKQQKPEEAEARFSQLLDQHQEHQLVAATRLARGMARRQAKKYPGAVSDLEAFLAGNPGQPDRSNARYELGLTQVSMKNYEDAIETFVSITKDDNKFVSMDSVLYEIAWAYHHMKKTEEAVSYFKQLADQFPKSRLTPDANFRLGEALYDDAKYKEAIERYSKAQHGKVGGELGENILHKLGWAHFQAKQYAEAFAQFDQQVKSHADGKLVNDARFLRAECLLKQEKYPDAQKEFQSILTLEFSSPQMAVLARLHGAQAAAHQNNWQDALGLVSPIPEKFPQSPHLAEVHFELGRCYQAMKKYAEAAENFETAADKNRGLVGAKSRFMLGELRFLEKKYDLAVGQFQRVMFGFGGKRAPAEIKTWQARSGFEAGRCEEVQIAGETNSARRRQLIENAKSNYEFVVKQHPNHPLVAQAKKRLETLAKL